MGKWVVLCYFNIIIELYCYRQYTVLLNILNMLFFICHILFMLFIIYTYTYTTYITQPSDIVGHREKIIQLTNYTMGFGK